MKNKITFTQLKRLVKEAIIKEEGEVDVELDLSNRNADAWSNGTAIANGKTYKVSIKHFDGPSQFGIDGGKISKLWISNGDVELAFYDRDWVTKPRSKIAKAIVNKLLEEFN